MSFPFYAPPPPPLSGGDSHWRLDQWGYPSGSSYWWRRFPERAVEEHEKMLNSTTAVPDFQGDSLVWVEEIKTNFGTEYLLAIVAGPYFPSNWPTAFAPEVDCDVHQFSDKSLCLAHPNDLLEQPSALKVRDMACAWFFAYDVYSRTGEWPAAEAD